MDWNIERALKHCSNCPTEFAEGDQYFSALYDQGDTFARKDFCPPCWDKTDGSKNAFSFWKTKVPTKETPKRLFVDDSILFDLFVRLQEQTADTKINFRYLLTLILMRKRLLKFDNIVKDGEQEYLVVRNPREQTTFKVLDPHLTDEQIQQVKDEMSQVLDIELTATTSELKPAE